MHIERISKDIIPDPSRYGVSLDDNKALSEFYWNYAGDYSGFAASLFSQNEAIFMYNDKGQLIAADYFSGEGKEVDNVYYEPKGQGFESLPARQAAILCISRVAAFYILWKATPKHRFSNKFLTRYVQIQATQRF